MHFMKGVRELTCFLLEFTQPTDNDYGKACTEDTSDTWFIGKCGFSGAFDALRFLYADDFRVIHPKSIMLFIICIFCMGAQEMNCSLI